ncbi:phage major capsid protein [Tianweitania sediminis]|uniref:Phage major capsid protein n=1 Tax=Tianweitania sediminis TaxID=1502156 RepID=A0A8J7RI85_9HYPH|nr:phage major capsid protein [Tianweitania sediminis]MBP0438896.1 phage major capsid protein [Tianweitania sediminis]
MTQSTPAPETKSALPYDVKGAFDDFMTSFEAFKDANDQRLGELETRMSGDVLATEKVDRISKALDDNKRKLDELLLRKARPALGGGYTAPSEHKAAFEAYVRSGDDRAMRALDTKAMSFGSGSDGGYLVPNETETQIAKRLGALSPIRSIASVRQVSTALLKKPFALTGPATGWVGETAARPQTGSPTLAELEFPTAELYAMPSATQALLEDSAVDLDSWLTDEIEMAFAEQEGTAFVTGNGVNKPKGFLASDKVADASWSWGSLGYLATGAAGAFAASNPADKLVDLVYALKAGYRENGSFVMNRKTQAAVRKMKDGDGNYLWQPPATVGAKAMLMGFPVVEAEDMPDIGTDAFAVAFGDFTRGYLVVDRTGVRILRDPYSAKPYVLFYVTKRVGGGVQDFSAIKLLKFGTA